MNSVVTCRCGTWYMWWCSLWQCICVSVWTEIIAETVWLNRSHHVEVHLWKWFQMQCHWIEVILSQGESRKTGQQLKFESFLMCAGSKTAIKVTKSFISVAIGLLVTIPNATSFGYHPRGLSINIWSLLI